MKLFSKCAAAAIVAALLVPHGASACFNTYLFLKKGSMVHPKGEMVVETSGEYVMPMIKNAREDQLSGATNVYYGISDRLAIQVGLSASERTRSDFSVDGYGMRGVLGIVQRYRSVYNLDIIVEHAAPFDGEENTFEVSTPNLFHFGRITAVVHPVTSFGRNVDFNLRGHGGVFYHLGDSGIVGIGTEYASAQSGSRFGRRLVRGEGATSLFFGSRIGSAYLQNEFIKGWGVGGSDFGFAVTLQYVLPSFAR